MPIHKQRRDADDALSYLSMTEMRDALIGSGVPGWTQKTPIPRAKAMDALAAASAPLANLLNVELRSKVVDADAAGAQWKALSGMLTGDRMERAMPQLMAQNRAQGAKGDLGKTLKLIPARAGV